MKTFFHRTLPQACAACGLLALCASALQASHWPAFRGPNGNGVGDGQPPVKWDVRSGENVVWKVKIEGLALSSPVVWGSQLFLTTAASTEGEPKFEPDPTFGYGIERDQHPWIWKVIGLEKTSGKRLWETAVHRGVPKQGRHSESTFANPTPATDGRRIVAMFGSEGLYCLDLEGRVLWKKDFGLLRSGPEGHPDLEWGYGSSPVIYQDKVVVQCDVQKSSFVAVLSLETGEERLRIDREDIPSWATPGVFEFGDSAHIVCNGHKNMAAYDILSGEKLWWLSARGDVPVPRPLFHQGLVLCTGAHGGRALYAVRQGAKGDLTPQSDDELPRGLAWWDSRRGSYLPTPLVYQDILYVGNERGVLAAFEPATGKLIYEERIVEGEGGPYYASPVAAAGRIYFTKNNGDIHVVAAGREFKRLAANSMGEPAMATPAISEGKLFVRTVRHLYCIGTSE